MQQRILKIRAISFPDIFIKATEGQHLILLDERIARQIALSKGLEINGLLGILGVAANRNLVNFTSAIERLQETNFYVSAQLIQSLLERYGADG